MLSKKQKQALKKPCPVCQGKTIEVGDLSDFKHDIVTCTSDNCQFALMYDNYRLDLDKTL